MSLQNKSFDFLGKMKNNKDFYLFDDISQEKKSEILSKFDQFKTAPEFFDYYTNKDIQSIFKSLEQLDLIYSHLLNENHSNNLQSKTDKYISYLSEIILLSNLISKNKIILEKAIINTKKNLEFFLSTNKINKNNLEEINEYILKLLGMDNRRNYHSLLFLNDNVSRSNTLKSNRPNLCFLNEKFTNINNNTNNINDLNDTNNINTAIKAVKIFDTSINNSLNQEITHDITNHTNNNSKYIDENIFIDFKTPKFPKRFPESNTNILYEENANENSNNKLKQGIIRQESLNTNNDEMNKNWSKKESIRSLITLASKSKFICQEEKEKAKGSSKFKDIALTGDKNERKAYGQKKSSKYHFTEYKLNNNINSNNNKDDNDNKEEGEIKGKKKQTFSSTNLKTSRERKMLKDLLGYINEIFKKEIINSEEKIKLKSLIISKNEKLENIYIAYFENNKDILIKELEKLI